MTTFSLFKALHLYGAILWVGGISTVALAALAFSSTSAKDGIVALRGVARRLTTPAMILAWAGGLAMVLPSFDVYMKQGWFHGKLLFVFIVAGLTGVITARMRKVELGKLELAESKLRGLSLIVLVLALLIVALAVLKPGA